MKAKNWIQLILLIGLILLGIIAGFYDKIKLEDCSIEGKAIIISKNKRKSRGFFIKYKYEIDTKEFEMSESIKKKIEVETFNVGDTIDIDISCTDFSISKFKKIK